MSNRNPNLKGYTKKKFHHDNNDPFWIATKIPLDSQIDIMRHELKCLKELQKKTKNKDRESQWGWRKGLAKFWIAYDVQIARTAEILKYCTQESIAENKKHIIRYLLACFDSWMSADIAVYAFEKFLLPYQINDEDILFTPVYEEVRTGKGIRDMGEIVSHVDIHIGKTTTKQTLLNYVEKNWEAIQTAFYEEKKDTRIEDEYLRTMAIHYLIVNSGMKPVEIRDVLDEYFQTKDSRDELIRDEKYKLGKKLSTDWFSSAAKTLDNDMKNNPKVYLGHILGNTIEKTLANDARNRLERFVLHFDDAANSFFLELNS